MAVTRRCVQILAKAFWAHDQNDISPMTGFAQPCVLLLRNWPWPPRFFSFEGLTRSPPFSAAPLPQLPSNIVSMASPNTTPSLVVKLRYTPICPKCMDVLSRWCSPSELGQSVRAMFGLHLETRSFFHEEITSRTGWGRKTPEWAWSIRALQRDTKKCRCCAFLLQVLEASPWVHFNDNDFIHVSSHLVGSSHITPYQREHQDWVASAFGPSTRFKEPTTTYERFYRPRLRVYQLQPAAETSCNSNDRIGGKDREPRYSPGQSVFIHPATSIESGEVEDDISSHAFLGRRVASHLQFSTIHRWLHKCSSEHRTPLQSYGVKFAADLYDERSSDERGCQPMPFLIFQDFRLIDVVNKCVVLVSQPTEYAALSYVWGTSSRLLLSKSNQSMLSARDALSVDKDDVPKTFRDAMFIAASLDIAYLWIDALCIFQDDPEQIKKHMELMETIYSSAVLTIVSDTPSANTGIPGVSLARPHPPQASFVWHDTTYLSARRTFGEALRSSPWERRAWCLQEKIFSKRLLVLTMDQAFFHCGAATWFEDTILEGKENISGAVHMRERSTPLQKGEPHAALYSAYESHRDAFGRNFWSLVENYSKRMLSFQSDTIRAFAGVLHSVESRYGQPVWGIPSFMFVQGLTWSQSPHRMSLRKHDFPSWTWAGWDWNADADLVFESCKRTDADMRVSEGRYRISSANHSGPSVWELQWFHHPETEFETQGGFKVIQTSQHSDDRQPIIMPKTGSDLKSPIAVRDQHPNTLGNAETDAFLHTWQLPGHPRSVHDSSKVEGLRSCQDIRNSQTHLLSLGNRPESLPLSHWQTPLMMPLQRSSSSQPHMSHVLRFYTSVVTVSIASNPEVIASWRGPGTRYVLTAVESNVRIASINLEPTWHGIGTHQTVIYISRWCPDFSTHQEGTEDANSVEMLNLLLVESHPEWGEIRTRVQLTQS